MQGLQDIFMYFLVRNSPVFVLYPPHIPQFLAVLDSDCDRGCVIAIGKTELECRIGLPEAKESRLSLEPPTLTSF